MDLLDIFSHKYDIRAKVLLSDGIMVNVKIPIKARGVSKEDEGDVVL